MVNRTSCCLALSLLLGVLYGRPLGCRRDGAVFGFPFAGSVAPLQKEGVACCPAPRRSMLGVVFGRIYPRRGGAGHI